MELLKEEFDIYIDKKNKEIEEILLAKQLNRKMKDDSKKSNIQDNVDSVDEEQQTINKEEEQININKIDYTTKKTISKIFLEQDRKLKSSKNYKKQQSALFLAGQSI